MIDPVKKKGLRYVVWKVWGITIFSFFYLLFSFVCFAFLSLLSKIANPNYWFVKKIQTVAWLVKFKLKPFKTNFLLSRSSL